MSRYMSASDLNSPGALFFPMPTPTLQFGHKQKSLPVQSSRWYQMPLPGSPGWQPSPFTLRVWHVACMGLGSCSLLIFLVQVRCNLSCVILLPVADSVWQGFLTFCFMLLTCLYRHRHHLVQIHLLSATSLGYFYHWWFANFPRSPFSLAHFKCSMSTLQNSSSSSSSYISVLRYEKSRTNSIIIIYKI